MLPFWYSLLTEQQNTPQEPKAKGSTPKAPLIKVKGFAEIGVICTLPNTRPQNPISKITEKFRK